MKNASIFSTVLLLLVALFISQTVQAQLTQNTTTKTITTNTDFNNAANAMLGVGTATPSNAKLNVQGAVGNTVSIFQKSATGKGVSIVSDWPGVYFNSYFNGSGKSMAAGYSGIVNFDPDLGRFDFGVTGTAAASANAPVEMTSRMSINKDGNVSIGGPSNAKLGVTSNLKTNLDNTMTWSNPAIGPNMSHVHFGLKGDWYIRSAANDGVVNIQDNSGRVAIGGPSNAKVGVTSNFKTNLDNTMSWSNPALGPNLSHVHFGLKGDWYIRSAANDGVVVIQDNGGRVAIGGTKVANGYKLSVSGKVICEELKVQLKSAWPDYVFADHYKLKSLEEVEQHIQAEKHLPGMPAAAEVEKEGLEIGDMQKKMMEKIEELTLYVIEINKENKALKQRLEQLENKK